MSHYARARNIVVTKGRRLRRIEINPILITMESGAAECEIVGERRPGGGLEREEGGKRPWLGSVISDTSQQAD